MTIEEARKILGKDYLAESDVKIQQYIDAAMVLETVFFDQFKDKVIDNLKQNERY